MRAWRFLFYLNILFHLGIRCGTDAKGAPTLSLVEALNNRRRLCAFPVEVSRHPNCLVTLHPLYLGLPVFAPLELSELCAGAPAAVLSHEGGPPSRRGAEGSVSGRGHLQRDPGLSAQPGS